MIAQGFVYAYLGLTFSFYGHGGYWWSPEFLIAELIIIFLCRGVAVPCTVGLFNCCGFKKDDESHTLSCKELFYITFAGLIRGAICFGLVLRLSANIANRTLLVTSSLTLVLFTTVVFGSTIGLVGACLFPKMMKGEKQEQPAPQDPAVEEADD